jgi:UDP-N-acetylmuramyl tripeptide synthase
MHAPRKRHSDLRNVTKNQHTSRGRLRDIIGHVLYRSSIGISISRTLPGVHNVYNALATLCTGMAHEIPMQRMVAALESFHGMEGRFDTLVSRDGVKVIDDSAHNRDALRNLLVTADRSVPGRCIVCLVAKEIGIDISVP